VVELEFPRVKKEDVKLTIGDGTLTITAVDFQCKRHVMRPLFKSYGDMSNLTRLPTVRRTQRFHILPQIVASTVC